MGSLAPLLKNQEVTTEVAPPNYSAIGLELNMIYDDFGGHNKSNTVLRGDLMISLLRRFRTAIVIFLVKAHTRNACDLIFNLMK